MIHSKLSNNDHICGHNFVIGGASSSASDSRMASGRVCAQLERCRLAASLIIINITLSLSLSLSLSIYIYICTYIYIYIYVCCRHAAATLPPRCRHAAATLPPLKCAELRHGLGTFGGDDSQHLYRTAIGLLRVVMADASVQHDRCSNPTMAGSATPRNHVV